MAGLSKITHVAQRVGNKVLDAALGPPIEMPAHGALFYEPTTIKARREADGLSPVRGISGMLLKIVALIQCLMQITMNGKNAATSVDDTMNSLPTLRK
jgi:hypothetical protein